VEAQSTLDSDLWAFFNDAKGDVGGLRAAPLEPSYGGGNPTDMPGTRLDAAAIYRTIELALGGLDPEEVEVLRLAHTPVPPALRPRFVKCGELTHVVIKLAPGESPHWVLENPKKVDKLIANAHRRGGVLDAGEA
jgi:hypothetical protein